MHLVKSMYIVGYCNYQYDDKCQLLQQVDLCKLNVGNRISTRSKTLAVKDEAELMSKCVNIKVDILPAHDKNRTQRISAECVEL